jgi:hypothetical protein
MLEKITQSHRNRSQTKTIFDLRPLISFSCILLFTGARDYTFFERYGTNCTCAVNLKLYILFQDNKLIWKATLGGS